MAPGGVVEIEAVDAVHTADDVVERPSIEQRTKLGLVLRHVVSLDPEEHGDLVVAARGLSHLRDVALELREGDGGYLPHRRLHC
jgi:hypothetical protein